MPVLRLSQSMSTMAPTDVSALMNLLRARWVMTLATNALPHDGEEPEPRAAPYVAPLFFAVAEPSCLAPGPCLIFVSHAASRHARQVGGGPTPVAAAVALESERVSALQGVQMRGHVVPVRRLTADDAALAHELYCVRHPQARAALAAGTGHALYAVGVEWAKLTDNARGLGVHPECRFEAAWRSIAPELA